MSSIASAKIHLCADEQLSDRRENPSPLHECGPASSMLGDGSIPFGDKRLQTLERGMPWRTEDEIVVDLFHPCARDAPRLLRRRHKRQRLRDRLLDNPIDQVGHQSPLDTAPSPKGGATLASIA